MANTFITMQNIAREALPILKNMLVFPALVHQDYSKDFVGQGDTIQIKKPPVFTANEFSTSISVQDTTFEKVSVQMDTLADVSVQVTSKELALSIPEFKKEVIEPMAVAIAEKVNTDGLELSLDVPYYSGTSGTTPDGLDDFAAIRKALIDRKAPMTDRRAVWDAAADAKLTQISNLTKVNESGSPQALREGEIGRIYGLENYVSQSVVQHTAGGATAATAPKVDGDVAAGATTMAIDGSAMTGKLEKGDLMTIAGNQYVVTAQTAAAASNAIASVSFYPAAPSGGIADNADITFPDASAGGHTKNVGFNKKAFAFVTRALPLPTDGANGYVVSYGGLTLRVVSQYDISAKKNVLSMDMLYAFKTIYPELAHIQLG